MAVVCGVRVNDMLRCVAGPVRRVLAETVQRGQVVGRHWLGVGLQEGRACRRRSNASARAGVSVCTRVYRSEYEAQMSIYPSTRVGFCFAPNIYYYIIHPRAFGGRTF